jgi:NADPH-dependent curcumin reductase CurA
MPELINRQIVLAAYPQGTPKDSDFKLVERPVPEPRTGQMLCRAIYLSLDPYMRGRISPAKSYVKGVEIGEVITGGTVSQVIRSKSPDFAAGDMVFGYTGWQDYAVCARC